MLATALRPGIDGLVVDAPAGRATFLPAVWRHFGDDVDGFLVALWRKAGLAPGSWPVDTRCSRYSAEKIVDRWTATSDHGGETLRVPRARALRRP